MDLRLLRVDLEDFAEALSREEYLTRAGLKEESRAAAIRERFALLGSREAFAEAPRAILGDAGWGGGAAPSLFGRIPRGRLRRVPRAGRSDRLATTEASQAVRVDGVEIPLRSIEGQIKNEADRPRRAALESARLGAIADLNGLRQEILELSHEEARRLGFTGYTSLCSDLSGIDLSALRALTQPILPAAATCTKTPFPGTSRAGSRSSPREAGRHDLVRLFRAAPLTPCFLRTVCARPPRRRAAACESTPRRRAAFGWTTTAAEQDAARVRGDPPDPGRGHSGCPAWRRAGRLCGIPSRARPRPALRQHRPRPARGISPAGRPLGDRGLGVPPRRPAPGAGVAQALCRDRATPRGPALHRLSQAVVSAPLRRQARVSSCSSTRKGPGGGPARRTAISSPTPRKWTGRRISSCAMWIPSSTPPATSGPGSSRRSSAISCASGSTRNGTGTTAPAVPPGAVAAGATPYHRGTGRRPGSRRPDHRSPSCPDRGRPGARL